ncbi:MAG: efflux RND transporter permease subunit [Planctomycetota bacterium]
MGFLRRVISASVDNPVLANLLMVCLLLGGWLSARRMVRETYPEFALDRISVDVVYPGAGPEEVEQGVCTQVEEAVQSVAGIKSVQSFAAENHGRIIVDLIESVRDPTRVLLDIKDHVAQITLPREAEAPVVTEEIIRAQVINIAIHGDMPERTLHELAREVREDLLADKEISSVTISGIRDYEITIAITHEALQRYGLSFADVAGVVGRNTMDLPAGTLRTRNEEITLRTVGQRYTARDFEDLVLIAQPDGTLVRLHQVAKVTDGFEDTSRSGRFNGQTAAMVSVYKTPAEDTSKIAAAVRAYVKRKQATLPEGIHLSVWADTSLQIDARIGMLVSDGLSGMAMACVLLTVFLNLRLSWYVAVGIPVSLAGALVTLALLGETINMISLLGLIMMTGIVVDDSIIICDRFDQRRVAGQSPKVAALEGTAEVALPVMGTALTTTVAFLPLLFVSGAMGKLIAILPIVVIASLLASQAEAFTMLPAHLAHAGGVQPRQAGSLRHKVDAVHARMRAFIDRGLGGFLARLYRPLCRRATNARGLTLCITLAVLLLVGGLVLGGRTPLVLFPEIDGNTLQARVRFPEGSSAETTRAAVERIERAAAALNEDAELKPAASGPLVRQTFSLVGEHPAYLPAFGSNLATVMIELMPTEQRRIDCSVIIDRWRQHLGVISDATALVLSRVELGPTDKPVEIRLVGADLQRLNQAAEELKAKLVDFQGVYDIEHDLIPGKRELHVSLKPAARTLGLTLEDLARQVRSGFYGGEAARVQRGRDEIVVRVRYPEAERGSLSDVEQMRVHTPGGEEVPFLEVADLRMVRGYASIEHQQGQRRCRVMANVDARTANAEQIIAALRADFLPKLAERYGIETTVEGQHAQIVESVTSLFDGFLIALVANYAILAGLLRSYVQPLVIMSAVPLGFVGALLGHWIMGYDLTLFSLFGMVALSGIVVNDSLILVDQVNRSIRAGMPILDAVRQTGEARFRAVLLTAICDVVGVLPLLCDRSTQAQTLIPMAISLAFGLVFATLLTLVVVPALYLAMIDLRRAVRWLRRGGAYPSAESVMAL